MSKMDKDFDFIIIGGGISGISVAEILSRNNKKVLLIEKGDKLAPEVTRNYHEWLHTGSLYTILPDNLLTTRYTLGAIDDLLEYYGAFDGMNLIPTSNGVYAKDIYSNNWFNNHNINYEFKVRKLNIIWSILVSKSISYINKISCHDWLRRRAGSEYGKNILSSSNWYKFYRSYLFNKSKFLTIVSPDMTMNSKNILDSLVKSIIGNGSKILLNCEYLDHDVNGQDSIIVQTNFGSLHGKKIIICSPDIIAKKYNKKIKISFAPIGVVCNIPSDYNSFVQLDYFPKNCINLINKLNGYAQIGGITLNSKIDAENYLKEVLIKIQKRIPEVKFLGYYIAQKKELVDNFNNRNYLYHIDNPTQNTWTVVLGKYTLAFSMAPELYRRLFNLNSTKINNVKNEIINLDAQIYNPKWQSFQGEIHAND